MTTSYGWQYEILPCPFCEKGKIQCMWYPSATTIKRNATASLPGGGSISKTKTTWVVKTGCSECGKNMEEVERKLSEEGII
jgi:hypothetical protein